MVGFEYAEDTPEMRENDTWVWEYDADETSDVTQPVMSRDGGENV